MGVLSTVGAVSLHQFGLLFLIPAMLMIRLEIALVAACLIATHTARGSWAGILLVTAAYAASRFAPVRLRAWLRDWPTMLGDLRVVGQQFVRKLTSRPRPRSSADRATAF